MKDRGKRILTIDQGNTAAKWMLWEDGNCIKTGHSSGSLSLENIIDSFSDIIPDGGIFCSTGHTDAKFLESLRRWLDGNLILMTPTVKLPIKVIYSHTTPPGSDRLATAVAAGTLFQGEALLIVDAGTAITSDITDSEGNFLGGNISPGISLRFRSLYEGTEHRLPLLAPSTETSDFGQNTQSAIINGVMKGVIGEISFAYKMASEKYGCQRIVVTGGDGNLIAKLLEEERLPLAYIPDLLARGLLRIYTYNDTK